MILPIHFSNGLSIFVLLISVCYLFRIKSILSHRTLWYFVSAITIGFFWQLIRLGFILFEDFNSIFQLVDFFCLSTLPLLHFSYQIDIMSAFLGILKWLDNRILNYFRYAALVIYLLSLMLYAAPLDIIHQTLPLVIWFHLVFHHPFCFILLV